MDKILINGGKVLEGEVNISGSKNSALPIISAALLNPGITKIYNVPRLQDIDNLLKILRYLGADCHWTDSSSLSIDASNVNNYVAPYDFVRKMRASICVLGPLLGRFGKAKISMPGGCVIGPRPIDLHLKGLSKLGAKIEIDHGYVLAQANRLEGTDVFIGGRYGSSVLATANILCAAVYAQGKTVIESAAMEPEIVDLVSFLKKMGADISGEGSSTLIVNGITQLNDISYTLIPDRIEAGTFMLATLITGGKVLLKNARADHLRCLIDVLREVGARIEINGQNIFVEASGYIKAVDIVTHPYPGFPTDIQAQMMALLSIADGISVITEKIYPERFMHVSELNRLGANISLEGSCAIIKGNSQLSGAPVMASDLRASAALIVAGLKAEGQTEVLRVYHLDRGYEKIDEKLRNLGADIQRVSEKDSSISTWAMEKRDIHV